MGNTGSSFFWPNQDPGRFGASRNAANARQAFLREVERSGFNWLVYLVAASGFFTDSYNLFASNVILPAIAYVYWEGSAHKRVAAFNLVTLGASAVGQLVFGYLADRFGRRSLYGIELIIVIISTVGLLQCSIGFSDAVKGQTWSITGWLLFWRTIMGLGIGAEYPLSACLAAEWSSTESRGRMISAVFLMQPLGQLCAYGAGLTALRVFGSQSRVDIDKLWRYVVAMGAIPTLLALAFRLFMPESGRYTFEVRASPPEDDAQTPPQDSGVSVRSASGRSDEASDFRHIRMTELWHFLYNEGHGYALFGTSACWFLLDFAFYGLGFNTPSTLSKLWTPANQTPLPANSPYWLISSSSNNFKGVTIVNGEFYIDPADSAVLIHDVLRTNMTHAIFTNSISSIIGSLLVIALINRFDRKNMLTLTFALLAILLIVVCASFKALFHKEALHIILIVFWVVISLLFSFGPNTLTFIIPAEVFPTRYRCTLYGFAAAMGKLGAVSVQIVIFRAPSIVQANSLDIRWLLLGFAICMGLGAVCSQLFVPRVQRRSAENDRRTGWRGRERRASLYVNIPLQDLPGPRRRAGIELRNQENGGLPSGQT